MFPNVPNVPGVPPLLRAPGFSLVPLALLAIDAARFFGGLIAPTWGVFDQDGNRVISANSVVGVQYRQTWVVANYQIEQGGFESYDKVSMPFDVRVRLASGSTQAERIAFLQSIAAIAGDTELYDVVTPDAVYRDVNVVHYDYRRDALRGAGMITVDLFCQEIRETGVAAFDNTRTPSGAGVANGGTVQASTYDEAGFSVGSLT